MIKPAKGPTSRHNWLRILGPAAIVFSVPFVYNACQGGVLGSKSFASKSVSCKVSSKNGIVTKMEVMNTPTSTPFSEQKVRLRQDSAPTLASSAVGNGAQSKVSESPPLLVKLGTELGVIMNNSCLQENRDTPAGASNPSVITRAALSGSTLQPQLDTQAYVWTLERDYTDDEISALADAEPCVVGISWNLSYKAQSVPNDPLYASQPYLDAMHAPASYDLFYNATGGMNIATGDAVVLADVDTGVDWTHPDLSAHIWTHSLGFGFDATTTDTSAAAYAPLDISPIGHGTHTSGLMAAVANNAVGIAGAMPYRSKIMAIRVFKLNASGDLTATSQYVYNGIKLAYLNGASVINLSLSAVGSGANRDVIYQTAFTEAIQAGTTVVVALGNADSGNGQDVNGTTFTSLPSFYATMEGAMGVGSIDSSINLKSYFSHYSTTYGEISAPGSESGSTGILSTVPNGLYRRLAGTSQATPLVSAAAGLAIGLIRQAYGSPPTPSEVERLILTSAVKDPNLVSYFKDGNRLDYLNLVRQINTDYPKTAQGMTSTTVVAGACH